MPARFGYFDMFAGPGIYDDGTPSTPLLVARQCLEKQWLRERVWMVFNDYLFSEELRNNFDCHVGIDLFPVKPHFGHSEVGNCQAIDDFLTKNRTVGNFNECPSVLFFDPFGYKAINTYVLCQFMKPFGNEIFLFFNSKRITPALQYEKFETDMRKLYPMTFEETRDGWHNIKGNNDKETKDMRLNFLIAQMEKEFRFGIGDKSLYCSHFRFQEDDSQGASHFLIHITKSLRGYDLVKQIFYKHSNFKPDLDGIGGYVFDTKHANTELMKMWDDAENEDNIMALRQMIQLDLKKFPDGISASDFYDFHQSHTQFSRKHYQTALRQLAQLKLIEARFIDSSQHTVEVLLTPQCVIKSV